jgi:peptide/nickel transport system substrate-binding protein
METALRPLMGELFIPAGMMIVPGVNGYAPEMDQPVLYDPDKARALLAEAGYPDGFSVTLDCPSEWGDDEIAECNGAAQQLSAVGIDVSINFLSSDEHSEKVEAPRQSDFFWTPGDPIRTLKGCSGNCFRVIVGGTRLAMPIRGSTS